MSCLVRPRDRAVFVARMAGLVAIVVPSVASAQNTRCSDGTTVVQRGDTVSAIAERCDVTEGAILAANPTVDGSADLRVGDTVRITQRGDGSSGIGQRLNSFATQANEALGRVAGRVESTTQDLLNKNPDLKSRLEGVGRKLGLGDGSATPKATVAPSSGSAGATVTVSATGLPAGKAVTVGVGKPGTASETVQDARVSSSGTLSANLTVPAWAAGSEVVFTVRGDEGVLARTERFRATQ